MNSAPASMAACEVNALSPPPNVPAAMVVAGRMPRIIVDANFVRRMIHLRDSSTLTAADRPAAPSRCGFFQPVFLFFECFIKEHEWEMNNFASNSPFVSRPNYAIAGCPYIPVEQRIREVFERTRNNSSTESLIRRSPGGRRMKSPTTTDQEVIR